MSSTLVGTVSLFLAAFLYGSQNIAARLTGIEFGPFLATALRNATVVFCLVWFVKWVRIQRNDWKWFSLRAVSNTIATTGLFFAINKMPVGMALFSFYASMMISSAIIGSIVYKEKMTLIKGVSLAITALGLSLVNLTNTSITFNWASIIVIIGGIGCSLWSIFSRPVSAKYSLKQLVFIDNAIAGLMALAISFSLHEQWQAVTFDVRLLGVLYMGLTQVFTGQLVAKGYKHVEAQIGSVILLNDTVIGMILAFLVFHETTSLMVILGGICIFLASIIPAIADHRKNYRPDKRKLAKI
jgi:drug/metabolite transporter (DMT)-like permease